MPEYDLDHCEIKYSYKIFKNYLISAYLNVCFSNILFKSKIYFLLEIQ